MDAMILAAGLGTRLRPLTDDTPKCLIEVGGRPLLDWVARRLIEAGAGRLIINVHHHAEQVRDYVHDEGDFGVDVKISDEVDGPLDTGGGLKAATAHFTRTAPFFLHNSDIITEIDLEGMYRAHREDPGALVTLAVGGRQSSRYLLFDDDGLFGYGNATTGLRKKVRSGLGVVRELPFAGIHVADAGLLDRLDEGEVFSIITTYMRLAQEGVRIAPYDIGTALWLEIGNPERLARARKWAADATPR